MSSYNYIMTSALSEGSIRDNFEQGKRVYKQYILSSTYFVIIMR